MLIALVSRFWEFCSTKTIENVPMGVDVLIDLLELPLPREHCGANRFEIHFRLSAAWEQLFLFLLDVVLYVFAQHGDFRIVQLVVR